MVDASGNLRVPGDYRAAYQFLGSWAVAAGQGQGSKEIHVVYASPGTSAAYRKNGRFPDGSVLVKDKVDCLPCHEPARLPIGCMSKDTRH